MRIDYTVQIWREGAQYVAQAMPVDVVSLRVTASPSGLRLENLFGGRPVSFADMSASGYLARRGIRTGIFIRRRNGRAVKLDWAGLLGFEIVLQAIANAGVPAAEDLAV